jgi:hypothetical protein
LAGELVERFARCAIEQDQAGLHDDIPRVNRLYDHLEMLEAELKSCGGDQWTALLTLYAHANAHVRLKAELATLAVTPNAAREVLQKIIERTNTADSECPWHVDGRRPRLICSRIDHNHEH